MVNEPAVDPVLSSRLTAAVARLAPGQDGADPRPVPSAGRLARSLGTNATGLADATIHLYHRTPTDLVSRLRVARARHRLLDTDDDIASIAQDVGFGAVGGLSQSMVRATGLAPDAYRALRTARAFVMKLPDWLAIPPLLRYWRRDPKSLTEQVEGDRLRFGMVVEGGSVGQGHVVRVDVTLRGRQAHCQVHARSRLPGRAAAEVHGMLVRMLGIDRDPRPFERAASTIPAMDALVAPHRGLIVPNTRDVFEAVLWVIAGQQVSLAAAFAMRRRLIARTGAPIEGGLDDGHGEGLHAPPTPAAVAALSADDLRAAGFSVAKAEYVLAAARDIVDGHFPTETEFVTAPAIESMLLARRGFGPWSVGYLMMRAWGFADCVPVGDVALMRRLAEVHGLAARPNAAETLERMRPYVPHRSLATFHYWSSGTAAQ